MAARGDPVAEAVRLVAEEGAALDDHLVGIVRGGGPLPHVADHVVEAKAVGLVRDGGRGALEAVVGGVGQRKVALPDVGAMLAVGEHQIIAPGVDLGIEAAARGKFPLGFGGQAHEEVRAELDGIVVRDVHDGMILAIVLGVQTGVSLQGGGGKGNARRWNPCLRGGASWRRAP